MGVGVFKLTPSLNIVVDTVLNTVKEVLGQKIADMKEQITFAA